MLPRWILLVFFLETTAIAESAKVRGGRLSVDPALEAWISRHSIAYLQDSKDLKVDRFENLDVLSRDYVSLKNRDLVPISDASQLDSGLILDKLQSYLDANNKPHPLHNYILSELKISPELRPKYNALMSVPSFNSCLKRGNFSRVSETKGFFSRSPSELGAWMAEVDLYRALWFKKSQFRKIVQGIKISDQEKFISTLQPFAEKYSWFAEMVPWVKIENGREDVAVNRLLAKNECEAAKQKYGGWVSGAVVKPDSMPSIMENVADVGRCFRKNGVESRVAALRDFSPVLEAKFGFEGKSALAVEVAKAYWSADKFTEARSILADIFTEALAENKLDNVGAAQHLLAQIYENEHRIEDAIINFEFYLGRYKDTSLTFEALRSLVLLYAEKQEWIKAAEAAQRMVAIQDSQPEEKREVNKAGFGLFWSGRSWLALGEKELASAAWKRLKTEYYSTYYGALGHFLLEASLGQVFDVEIANDKAFSEEEFLFSPFDESDRLRVKSILVFLRAGLSKEADCEIDELADQKNPSKDFARALLYSSSGAWLKSVKVFDELPRSYRNNLPRGSERILFPIRYKETIENFALRLNMDPDFVIGLIRQESLFDSQAMSPVGAKGLMQLMEATAQMEVKRMDSNYFEQSNSKSDLLQAASSNIRLFETEANLMIGIHHVNTLMKKYGSPVFTLSAYNAGPGAMLKWKDKFDSTDLLLFAEKIPYKETNSYVKLILRNYFYYKKWYRDTTLSMPHLEAVASPLVKMPLSVPKDEVKEKNAVSL